VSLLLNKINELLADNTAENWIRAEVIYGGSHGVYDPYRISFVLSNNVKKSEV